MLARPVEESALRRLMAAFPVTAILGPRQSGKSTLARVFAALHFLDLEHPRDTALLEQPQLALVAPIDCEDAAPEVRAARDDIRIRVPFTR